MNSADRARIAKEVNEAGRCSHPVRLHATHLDLVTGEYTKRVLKVGCKDRRESVCPACSRTYGTDAWILVATGINGGKGVSDEVTSCPRMFVTLTAPSFGSVHTIRSTGRCVQNNFGDAKCQHGWSKSCGLIHQPDDRLLGRPICDSCFMTRDAVLWNAHASQLWTATILLVRRNLAALLGVKRTELTKHASVNYLKVAEMQRRGLVHFHALVRLDPAESGAALDSELRSAWSKAVRSARIRNELGLFEWGENLDIQTLESGSSHARAIASYLAKYVTKTAGEGLELARQFRSRRQIVTLVDNPHLRNMALEAWDLSSDARCSHFKTKSHAHTLGYTGQLMTKSRGYSTTLTALRLARRDYRSVRSDRNIVTGEFSYAGRGYDDSRSSSLAELLVELERDLREQGDRRSQETRCEDESESE